jgi:hypothetical protein
LDVARGTEVAPRALGGLLGRVLTAAGEGRRGVVIRAAAVAAAAVVAAEVHRVHDPGILCPVRAVTGVPCPFCGGTTVFMELGAARPGAAIAANPVVFTGMVGLVTAPLGSGSRWWAISPRTRLRMLIVVLALSWLWQLARFGLLPF